MFSASSAAQQAALRQAAANTLDGVGATLQTEAEAAATYCEAGGGVALAEPSAVAEIEQAAEPIYEALERDPATKELIAEIRALAEATAAEPELLAACEQQAGGRNGSGLSLRRVPQRVLRVSSGPNTDSDPERCINTLTFEAGSWLHHVEEADVEVADCGGTYTVPSGGISLIIGGSPAPETGCGQDGWVIVIAGWESNGDEFRFTDIRSGISADPLAEVMWCGKCSVFQFPDTGKRVAEDLVELSVGPLWTAHGVWASRFRPRRPRVLRQARTAADHPGR